MLEDLKKSAERIKMSDRAKERIIENCYSKTQKGEENIMGNNRVRFRKISVIAAVLAVCIISAGAVITHVRGFRDVVKDGTVVGTTFDEETEMIDISSDVDKEKLLVSVSVVDYSNPPYLYAEEFGIANYLIVDEDGNILEKNNGTLNSKSGFADGKATFEIPIDTIPTGKYTLVINSFELSSKADQPLHVDGKWACIFVK